MYDLFSYFLILKQIPWKENQKDLCWKAFMSDYLYHDVPTMSLATVSYDTLYLS